MVPPPRSRPRSERSHARPASPAGIFLLATGILLALLSAVPLRGADNPVMPGIDTKWRYFASPNFELYSRNDDSDSRELLHNLELLRAVFLERMKLEVHLHVSMTVYYFRTKRDFQAYAPDMFQDNSALAGFYLYHPDRAIISMAPSDNDEEAQQTIFHEYVHHLFRMAEYDPPLWFSEGTANVLAGIQFDGRRVKIGLPLVNCALYLRQESMLPLDQLFAADKNSKTYTAENHTGVFYAESWALLHFWNFGNSGFSKESVDRFLHVASNRTAASATDLRKLFKECFGCDYPEMEHRLRNYIHTGSFNYGLEPTPKIPAASSYPKRSVPVDEIALRLAELAVRVNRSPTGKLVLLDAMSTHPTDTRSFETLGSDALVDGDTATASERWEQALAAGSTNQAIVRELALMEGRDWFRQFDPTFHLPDTSAARMRERLLKSIEAEPTQTACYEMLAWVEAFASAPEPKNINLVIAHLPGMRDKIRTLLGLSMVMLRFNRPDQLNLMLDAVEHHNLDPWEANADAQLRRQAETRFPVQASRKADDNSDATATVQAATPELKIPSVTLPDDL